MSALHRRRRLPVLGRLGVPRRPGGRRRTHVARSRGSARPGASDATPRSERAAAADRPGASRATRRGAGATASSRRARGDSRRLRRTLPGRRHATRRRAVRRGRARPRADDAALPGDAAQRGDVRRALAAHQRLRSAAAPGAPTSPLPCASGHVLSRGRHRRRPVRPRPCAPGLSGRRLRIGRILRWVSVSMQRTSQTASRLAVSKHPIFAGQRASRRGLRTRRAAGTSGPRWVRGGRAARVSFQTR